MSAELKRDVDLALGVCVCVCVCAHACVSYAVA